MNLVDKMEKVANLKSLYNKHVEDVKVIEKALADADKDKLEELEKDLQSAMEKAEELKGDYEALEQEVETETEELKALAEKSKNGKEVKKTMTENYLKTKQAMTDFANIQLEAGADRNVFKQLWEENLKEKGITNPEILLPQPVVSAIVDAFENSGSILSTFTKTGLNALKMAFNIETGINSRARGHKRGVNKKEQVITLSEKELRAQYIYKYITIDKETLRENNDTNAIIKYVLTELPQRVVAEIERAAIIGDGREDADEDKIKKVEAIIDADGAFKKEFVASSLFMIDDLVLADAEITAPGTRYAVMNRKTLGQLKVQRDGNGNLLTGTNAAVAERMGVSAIYTPDWFPEAVEEGDILAVEYVGPAYKLVGDNVIDSFDNFILQQNKHEYLAEMYVGGGLMELNSAVVVKKGAEPVK